MTIKPQTDDENYVIALKETVENLQKALKIADDRWKRTEEHHREFHETELDPCVPVREDKNIKKHDISCRFPFEDQAICNCSDQRLYGIEGRMI